MLISFDAIDNKYTQHSTKNANVWTAVLNSICLWLNWFEHKIHLTRVHSGRFIRWITCGEVSLRSPHQFSRKFKWKRANAIFARNALYFGFSSAATCCVRTESRMRIKHTFTCFSLSLVFFFHLTINLRPFASIVCSHCFPFKRLCRLFV